MRLLAAALLGLCALPAQAQEAPPGTDVESVALEPGQSSSFRLAPGFSHQLLQSAAPGSKGAITVRYEVAGGRSTVTATSLAGRPLRFTVLADPDGNGGFQPMGTIDLPGDGKPVSRSWPGALGTINVGDFTGP